MQTANKCIIYARVSTTEQGNTSLDAQVDSCRHYAQQHGYSVINVVRECSSAFRGTQRELRTAIDEMREGTTILVTNADRFSRNTNRGAELLNHICSKGCAVVSILDNVNTNSTMGRFHLLHGIVDGERQSSNIGDKIRLANNARARLGHHIGPVPYGWEVHANNRGIRKLVQNTNEMKVVRLVQKLRKGNLSATKVTSALRTVDPRAEPVEFVHEDTEEPMGNMVANYPYWKIASLLNLYNIQHRNSRWTMHKVATVCKGGRAQKSDLSLLARRLNITD